MASFEITLSDGSVERVEGADGYELEGPLTTFFRSAGPHSVLDSWSTRLASYRSSDVAKVRRSDGESLRLVSEAG